MIHLSDGNLIKDIGEKADTHISVDGWTGIVAEVEVAGDFDGTIVYFPGVHYHELKG
jgi:hypothetical protein